MNEQISIYSPFWQFYKDTQLIKISIANKYSYIQAQCPYGRSKGLICRQGLYQSELWAVVEEETVRPILLPVLKCCFHKTNNVSRIYGWKSESDKFIKGKNDIIINYYQMWTLIPWTAKPRSYFGWNKQRYHYSDSALEQLVDNFVLESLVLCLHSMSNDVM